MAWQDILITIIMFAFSYALIPQAYKCFKEKKALISLQTSTITAAGMYILSGVYVTLNLYFSSVMSLINAILWTILLIQRIIYKK